MLSGWLTSKNKVLHLHALMYISQHLNLLMGGGDIQHRVESI